MKQENIQENTMGCTCFEWKQNIRHLESLLLLGMTHGREYHSTSFRFCPWCGQPLSAVSGRRNEALLEASRQRIDESFFATDAWGTPQTPNMLVAARSCRRLSTGDR